MKLTADHCPLSLRLSSFSLSMYVFFDCEAYILVTLKEMARIQPHLTRGRWWSASCWRHVKFGDPVPLLANHFCVCWLKSFLISNPLEAMESSSVYMCFPCYREFNTLEEVLQHQLTCTSEEEQPDTSGDTTATVPVLQTRVSTAPAPLSWYCGVTAGNEVELLKRITSM